MSKPRQSKIIWFTGMSGAGKSFYAKYLNNFFVKKNLDTLLIDGDVIRDKYNISVGFTYNEVCENNRNISNLCKSEYLKHDITIVSVISPYQKIREEIKKLFDKDIYFIYVYSDINSLKKRDTKGLYKKADNGIIDNLIGYSDKSVYEKPIDPNVTLNTSLNKNPEDNYKILEKFIFDTIL